MLIHVEDPDHRGAKQYAYVLYVNVYRLHLQGQFFRWDGLFVVSAQICIRDVKRVARSRKRNHGQCAQKLGRPPGNLFCSESPIIICLVMTFVAHFYPF